MTSKAFGLAQLGNAFADGALSNRNLIINGAMQVAQRGTSHTYSNGQSGYHTLDRFFSAAFVSGGTLAVSQQSVSLSDNIEAEFFLRATTTGSVAAGSATIYSETRVENLKFFHNKTLTLSFYAKADAALTFQVRTYKNYGSGGSAEEYSGFSDISVTNSWTKYTLTFSAEDLSSKTFGTSSYFGVMFYWSTGQGSNQLNDNSIDITLVQLEAGDTATPFEHRSYGQELALCMRYFQQLGGNSATIHAHTLWLYSTLNGSSYVFFPTPMRASPTCTVVGTPQNVSGGSVGSDKWSVYYNGAWRGCNAIALNTQSQIGVRLDADSINSMAGGGAAGLYGGDQCNLIFSAEL